MIQTEHQHQHSPTQPTASSPISTKPKHTSTIAGVDPNSIVPQDDPRRIHPLDPSVSSVRLPASSSSTTTMATGTSGTDPSINPLTLSPFTADELRHNNYAALLRDFGPSSSSSSSNNDDTSRREAARRARADAVAELKTRIDEAERRRHEIEREMEEKEKIRETERRVWAKRKEAAAASAANSNPNTNPNANTTTNENVDTDMDVTGEKGPG